MERTGGSPERGGSGPLYQSRRPGRGSGRSPWPFVAGAVVLLLLLGGGWYWWRSRTEPVPEVPVSSPVEAASPAPAPTTPPLDLPPLGESDPLVREMAETLSEHPAWASWLVPDGLVRRFVTVVVNVANGDSPRSDLDHLAPEEPFEVRESGDAVLIDPESYARYDRLTETFMSVDAGTSATLYRQLHPLFEDAYRELGLSGTFDGTFAVALGNLMNVYIPVDDVAVERTEAVYVYVDPELEGLTPAEKHILRLGPENGRRVQDKLGDLAAALGITPGDPGAVVRR